MKTFVISAVAAGFLVGCASTDNDLASSATGPTFVDDQPQTAVAGEGSLMPGAYDSRRMQTGQFTGRERTNDQVGQRPTLPREADARELARSEEGLADGAGTLGQSGIVPDRGVSAETLMETSEVPIEAPAHVAVKPPGSVTEQIQAEGVGAPAGSVTGAGASTNAPAGSNPTSDSVPRPE